MLGWLNLLGMNIIGGALFLWFASKLRKNSNGFRKATIALLGLHILICSAVISIVILEPSHKVSFIMWIWEIHSPVSVIIINFAFIALCLRPMYWLFALGTRAAFERRVERGLCPRCGYDVRASVERCPECNEPIPPPSAAATELLARLSNL